MALFAQWSPLRTTSHPPFIGDPATGLLHRVECPARPPQGVGFNDRQTALDRGYGCCTCATPAVVAPADRIRALLDTTLPNR